MGGTGATLVVPFLFMLFAKSKQLKAVGKTTFVPVCFAVNEPLLFATPIVLNPYFFIPFLITPMINVSLLTFIKAYDATLLEEEKEKEALDALEEQVEKEEAKEVQPLSLNKNINVLVLCVGAGTSAMFANAVKEGAEIENLPIDATASAYGSHYDILKDYDIVVLSPQVQSHLEEVQQDASKYGTKVVATKGAQYIKLTRDPKGAVEFICEQVKEG